ncbi:MAG: hypothetical protein IPK74_39565 [Deltaproteobacteria bacterium]|nr:hypothetical protein [Deltaproteobacteria bacterium]
MQRLLDVRCHLRYIANDLHTSDRTAMHMQEVARECLEKTHSMRVLEREHEARIRADERARIAAAIEDAHQQGTYPYEMARSIRANATPSGHQLDAGWHERAVAAARADERSKCEAEVASLRAALEHLADLLRRRSAAEPKGPT